MVASINKHCGKIPKDDTTSPNAALESFLLKQSLMLGKDETLPYSTPPMPLSITESEMTKKRES